MIFFSILERLIVIKENKAINMKNTERKTGIYDYELLHILTQESH